MHLQTTHNSTTSSLQRELDTLRQEHQRTKVQLRELEMGNDDLERNERAISTSLADAEQKYSRTLEEKILLEEELFQKANVEQECQRLKDELRGEYVAGLATSFSYRLFAPKMPTRKSISSRSSWSPLSSVLFIYQLPRWTPPRLPCRYHTPHHHYPTRIYSACLPRQICVWRTSLLPLKLQ